MRCLLIAFPLAAVGCTPGMVPPGGRDAGPSATDAGRGDAGPRPLDCAARGACADPGCDGEPCAAGVCADGACVPTTEVLCSDGLDDDRDGDIDCADDDCECGPRVEVGAVRDVTSVGGTAASMAEGACPDGHVVVGVAGRSGEYLDHVQPICAPLVLAPVDFSETVLQVTTGAHAVVATTGPSGGDAFADHCPDDMVLTRLTVRSGSWIDGIDGWCEALFVRPADPSGWTFYGDGADVLPVRGSADGPNEEDVTCGSGGAFTQIDTRYATYTDRVTLHCHDLAVIDG